MNYKTVVRNFYPDLEEAVQKAEKELEQVKIEDEVSDVICDQCGRHMVIKYGPTESSWPVRDFRNVGIQKPILKRLVYPVRNAVRIL